MGRIKGEFESKNQIAPLRLMTYTISGKARVEFPNARLFLLEERASELNAELRTLRRKNLHHG
jgi:hypothetical protein